MINEELKPNFNEMQIKHAFSAFDLDGDRQIDAEKLRLLFVSLGDDVPTEDRDEMIWMLNSSKNGKVSYGEFSRMARNMSHGYMQLQEACPSMASYNDSSLTASQQLSRHSLESTRTKKNSHHHTEISFTDADHRISVDDEQTRRSSSHRNESIPSQRDLIARIRVTDIKAGPTITQTSRSKHAKMPSRLSSVQSADEGSSRQSPLIMAEVQADAPSHSKQAEEAKRAGEVSEVVQVLVRTSYLPPQSVELIVNLFISFTYSLSRELKYYEFLSLVNSKLPEDKRLEDDRLTRRIFKVLDKDKSGSLNLNEFVESISMLARPNTEELFRFVFKVFDADEDGKITRNELARILKLNTSSIRSDEQAFKKADEILLIAGGTDLTLEGYLKLGDKRFALLYPVQENARKIAKLLA
jgi:Ca2+-binding EF-hand superfamily protein